MAGRIVVCGNLVQDILVRTVHEPLHWGASEIVESILPHPGGNGGTTSYALAKLGAPVKLMTLVGHDSAAEALLRRLRDAGVDTSLVEPTHSPTSTAICLINSTGQRAILYHLGASAATFQNPLTFDPADSHFHVNAVFRMKDLRHRAPEMLRAAKAAGLATSIDTQWDHEGLWMKSLEPCLPHTDLLFVNEDEGRELTGYCSPPEIARHLRGLGAGEVVVKLGAKGCFVSGFSMPALPVSVVDTTGAGDCFVGGYLAALHRGMNHREAAAVANRVGALAVQKLGASSAMEELFPTEFWAE